MVCYYTVLVARFVDLLLVGWVLGFFWGGRGGRFVCLVDFLVA